MKFVVDQLPYYEEVCPFWSICWRDANDILKCPRHWDKYKVDSDENPHECNLLIEAGKIALIGPKEENRRCRTCRHFGDINLQSTCAPCYGYSNWEAKND